MPTIFTHAIAGAAVAMAFAPRDRLRTAVTAAGAIAMLPDADALGFYFSGTHEALEMHRGITHSIAFAATAACALALALRRGANAALTLRLVICLFAACLSHGLLDALTDGGSGIAFFAPFDDERYFFPWTPIRVAPLRASVLFSARGARVMASEMTWVWLPAALIAGTAAVVRRRRRW